MNRTRLWRTTTAGLAAAALLTMSAGIATASTTAGEIPETGLGGFAGYAEAEGVIAFVGLPAALAEGLDPLLQALGIAGTSPLDGDETSGLRIDLARVQADLERAAAGEDISSESSAFITNLILASADFDEPGACQGGPIEVAVPEDLPFLTFTLAGVDCEESDERAFADVQITGLGIFLGNLIAQGDSDGQLAAGIQAAIDGLNENLLANANELLCPIGEGLLGDDAIESCDADEPILQLENPLEIDIPLIDLDLIQATAEVTQDGDSVTATATSSVAGLNTIGVVCADQVHTSTATSDGTTASRDANVTSLDGSTCNTDQTLFRLLLGDGPLGDVGLFDAILQDDALDGSLEPLFEGLNELLDALSTAALTGGTANLGPIEGAGTTASTSPFVVAQTIPFDAIEPLEPLGEIRIVVAGGHTAVGVNAVPAGVEPPAAPEQPEQPAQPVTPAGPGDPATPTNLPRTGAGAGALLGLAALGAAAALRRRSA
ncbi:hypothetical protein [Nitriliruptor alkaliphilus]|uniref:hypothetical protein n=1 Tax=Nitriliruptor alkaliphilus TaxID=427918 RepID=UPI00069682F6|nr:hypothetical protein [Nitriliruptor alkaliphilus]